MKVLLIGGSGLLGHNVLRQLVASGHSVVALVRRQGAIQSPPNLYSEIIGSPLDMEALARAAQGCRAIINCAGVTDMSLLRYEDYLPINRDLCECLVEVMEAQQITTLVHVSTANTIGYGTAGSPADENAPMQPPFSDSFYAQSKREGEQLLQAAAQAHPEWHIVILNPGFIVGAYDVKPSSGRLLLAAYRRRLMAAPAGGKSFIAAEAAAMAVVNALTLGRNGERYLLTGENLSLKEFYSVQAQICGYHQKLFTLPSGLLRVAGCLGDLLRRLGLRTQLSTNNVRQLAVREYYDSRRATTELQMPKIPIQQAVRQFFEWYAK